jgi:hypothetical protein
MIFKVVSREQGADGRWNITCKSGDDSLVLNTASHTLEVGQELSFSTPMAQRAPKPEPKHEPRPEPKPEGGE